MLDQSRFRLLSGSTVLDCLSLSDFETVRDIMAQRLRDSLCIIEPLEEDDDNILLWEQLLSDALAVSVQVKQDDGIQSENMRNYSYQLRDYANTWQMLAQKSSDLLGKFNACENAVTFQTDWAGRIYGPGLYGCRSCEGHCECL